MINSLINIGRIIRSDERLKVDFFPLKKKRTLSIGKNDEIEDTLSDDNTDEKYLFLNLTVNLDNSTVDINEIDKYNYAEKYLDFMPFRLSTADANSISYLIGNFSVDKIDKIKRRNFLRYDTFVDDFLNLKNPEKHFSFKTDSIIIKYRKILKENETKVYNFIDNNIGKNTGIRLLTYIIKDGKTFYAETCKEIIDEMDEMFLQACYVNNNEYSFKKQWFPFYLSEKISGKDITFSREDMLNLFYARKIYESSNCNVREGISLLVIPIMEKMSYSEFEIFFKTKYNFFEFNTFIKKIEKLISENVEFRDEEIIKLKLNFDLVFRTKGAHTMLNIVSLPGVRYLKIKDINNKINRCLIKSFGDLEWNYKDKTIHRNILSILNEYYDNDKIVLSILKDLLIKDTYICHSKTDDIFINMIISNERDSKNTQQKKKNDFNKNYKNYKFLKYMENENFLMDDISYKLGKTIPSIEGYWEFEDARQNLKNYCTKFASFINKNVNSINDIDKYVVSIQERCTINGYARHSLKEYEEIRNLVSDDNFDKTKFILGYFVRKYENKQQ